MLRSVNNSRPLQRSAYNLQSISICAERSGHARLGKDDRVDDGKDDSNDDGKDDREVVDQWWTSGRIEFIHTTFYNLL